MPRKANLRILSLRPREKIINSCHQTRALTWAITVSCQTVSSITATRYQAMPRNHREEDRRPYRPRTSKSVNSHASVNTRSIAADRHQRSSRPREDALASTRLLDNASCRSLVSKPNRDRLKSATLPPKVPRPPLSQNSDTFSPPQTSLLHSAVLSFNRLSHSYFYSFTKILIAVSRSP